VYQKEYQKEPKEVGVYQKEGSLYKLRMSTNRSLTLLRVYITRNLSVTPLPPTKPCLVEEVSDDGTLNG
jgi:hypothetical protein